MTDPLLNYFLLLNMISLLFFLFSLCSSIVMFIVLHVKQKRSPKFKKRRGRTNLKINLKIHHMVGLTFIKEALNKLSMTKKSLLNSVGTITPPTPTFDPRHSRNHGSTLPTPPRLFSKLYDTVWSNPKQHN